MSPLGAAIVALVLTIIIGYVVGQVAVIIAVLVAAGFAAAERFDTSLVVVWIGWGLAIIIWLTTIVLMIFRIIDLVTVAT